VSTITWLIPRQAFYRHLQGLMDAGLGKRVMFGSDQMEWPEVIGLGVEAIESAPFLTPAQPVPQRRALPAPGARRESGQMTNARHQRTRRKQTLPARPTAPAGAASRPSALDSRFRVRLRR